MPPMPDPPSPVLEVQQQWEVQEDVTILNRIFFGYTGGPPSVADCVAFATNFADLYATAFAPLCPASTLIAQAIVTDITTHTGARGESSVTVTPGTRTGSKLPIGTCVLVNQTVGRRYRGGKPRAYLPLGVSGDLASSGQWSSVFTGDVETAWLSVTTGVEGVTHGSTTLAGQLNISYFEGVNAPVTLPSGRVKQSSKLRTVPLLDGITGSSVSSLVASQRRRNRAL